MARPHRSRSSPRSCWLMCWPAARGSRHLRLLGVRRLRILRLRRPRLQAPRTPRPWPSRMS
eukprot:3507819-Alexandrium_andersonii.AAC.1